MVRERVAKAPLIGQWVRRVYLRPEATDLAGSLGAGALVVPHVDASLGEGTSVESARESIGGPSRTCVLNGEGQRPSYGTGIGLLVERSANGESILITATDGDLAENGIDSEKEYGIAVVEWAGASRDMDSQTPVFTVILFAVQKEEAELSRSVIDFTQALASHPNAPLRLAYRNPLFMVEPAFRNVLLEAVSDSWTEDDADLILEGTRRAFQKTFPKLHMASEAYDWWLLCGDAARWLRARTMLKRLDRVGISAEDEATVVTILERAFTKPSAQGLFDSALGFIRYLYIAWDKGEVVEVNDLGSGAYELLCKGMRGKDDFSVYCLDGFSYRLQDSLDCVFHQQSSWSESLQCIYLGWPLTRDEVRVATTANVTLVVPQYPDCPFSSGEYGGLPAFENIFQDLKSSVVEVEQANDSLGSEIVVEDDADDLSGTIRVTSKGLTAIKVLSAIDLPGKGSNQHEIQGVKDLRRILGPDNGEKRRIRFEVEVYGPLHRESAKIGAEFSWYDARRNSERRSEYRLYYPPIIARRLNRFEPGDFAVFSVERGDTTGEELYRVTFISRESLSFKRLAQQFDLPLDI